jgi:flagellar biosynthetic protein FliQ
VGWVFIRDERQAQKHVCTIFVARRERRDARENIMTPEIVTELGRQALETTLLVSTPILGLSLVVGLVVSAFQAMTQLNEPTLSFVPKILTLFGALLVFLPWMLNVLSTFMANLLSSIPNYVQ